MSGGYFDYKQFQFEDIARSIDELIRTNDCTDKNDRGYAIGKHYSVDVIEKFKETACELRRCAAMVNRVDYLVSADDGEEEFREKWEEEVPPKRRKNGTIRIN